jgi:hypothetical protein
VIVGTLGASRFQRCHCVSFFFMKLFRQLSIVNNVGV